MYKDHPLFQQPPPNTIIWRYFNEDNFLNFLETGSLHFAKASLLKDPFEGRYPHEYKPMRMGGFDRSPFDRTPFDRVIQNFVPKEIKESTYICCFTVNDYESDLLWKAYLSNSKGATIQTTVGKLKNCFDSDVDEDIFIGEVDYLDYKTESFENGSNPFIPFLHKRAEYKHDDELRVITNNFSTKRETTKNGVYIPISLKTLLEKIVMAPYTTKDFEEKVISLCKKKSLDNIVIHSTLEDQPKF
jgi:hypothetical protein